MKQFWKAISLLLCLCMLLGMSAMAEEAAAPADLDDAEVLATLNGEPLTWGETKEAFNQLVAQYSSYYDMNDPQNTVLFRAVAVENALTEKLMLQKAAELGVSKLAEEEYNDLAAQAEQSLEAAYDQYVQSQRPDITEESSEEDKAAAREEAVQIYQDAGYTVESMTDTFVRYAVLSKVQDVMTSDVTVTDADVEALYQQLLEQDKALYENDLAAYAQYNEQVEMMSYYAAMYGQANDMDYAWYKPEGFRGVKHILLPVDEALMTAYTDLQARLEEQAHAEEEHADGAEGTEGEAEPAVTAEDVNMAKANVLASVADKIDEINTQIADGADFDELIATYGVNADGTPSDPGMAAEPYKTTGYEVCAYSSNYVPEFVEAAMSIAEVGGVSAPYLSTYGVHIVKYVADIPGGPIEMTDAQRAAKASALQQEKAADAFAVAIQGWLDASEITYTGVVPSLEELTAQEAAETPVEETPAE